MRSRTILLLYLQNIYILTINLIFLIEKLQEYRHNPLMKIWDLSRWRNKTQVKFSWRKNKSSVKFWNMIMTIEAYINSLVYTGKRVRYITILTFKIIYKISKNKIFQIIIIYKIKILIQKYEINIIKKIIPLWYKSKKENILI